MWKRREGIGNYVQLRCEIISGMIPLMSQDKSALVLKFRLYNASGNPELELIILRPVILG
jgi:hypothetical protein